MRRTLLIALMALFLLIPVSIPVSAQEAANPDVVGAWGGTLVVPGAQLRIVFRITRNADGTLSTMMDSLDQGAVDIPMDVTRFDGRNLHLELTAAQAVYDGVMNDAATEFKGLWKQGGSAFELNLTRKETPAALNRPQNPVPPFPYRSEDVVYSNTAAGITLAGTLTIPSGKGPFPAAILITGSGAQDRDESLLGHKPFLVIADYLTRRGTAVLRVDDRGVGGSTGNTAESTSADFAGDVLSGVQFLKGRPEIDPSRIGLIGHSEGGMIAPMVAAQSKDVAYIVLLAGPGLTGEEIVRRQNELQIRAAGGNDAVVAQQQEYFDRLLPIVRMTDPEAINKAVQDLMAWIYGQMSDAEKQSIGNDMSKLEIALRQTMNPWFRYFIDYDPVPVLRKVTCPVLALNGSKDLQVPPKEDLAAIAAALEEGGNQDYTTLELPGLNHLFQHCQTGLGTEYGIIEETFAPEALQIMADWILQRMGK